MKTIILFILFTLTNTVLAVQSYPGKIEFNNNDGTSFTGRLVGDEWFNYVKDSQGYIIKYNAKSKNYEYAKIIKINGENELLPNGIAANSNNALSFSQSSSNNGKTITSTTISKKELVEIAIRHRKNALKGFNLNKQKVK